MQSFKKYCKQTQEVYEHMLVRSLANKGRLIGQVKPMTARQAASHEHRTSAVSASILACGANITQANDTVQQSRGASGSHGFIL